MNDTTPTSADQHPRITPDASELAARLRDAHRLIRAEYALAAEAAGIDRHERRRLRFDPEWGLSEQGAATAQRAERIRADAEERIFSTFSGDERTALTAALTKLIDALGGAERLTRERHTDERGYRHDGTWGRRGPFGHGFGPGSGRFGGRRGADAPAPAA